jgi:hypothetical protein
MSASRTRRSGGTGARGRKLLRDTHQSKTDPEARLFKRSGAAEAKPGYLGQVITENRHGLVVEAMVSESGQRAEREAALSMLGKLRRRGPATLGARLIRKSTSLRPCGSRTSRRMWPSMRPPSTGRTG